MTWTKLIALLSFSACLWIGQTGCVQAAPYCNTSYTYFDFGTTYTERNQSYTSGDQIVLYCYQGSANEVVRACVMFTSVAGGDDSANGLFYMKSGSNILKFGVYYDSAYSQFYTLNTYFSYTFSFDSGGSTASISIPLYGRVPSGQTTVPPGSYATTIATKVISGDATTLNSSCSGTPWSTWTGSLSAQATNKAECTITGGTLSFGSVAALTANVDSSATITANCVSGLTYTVALDGGQNGGTSATNRKMANGGNTVTYGLYTDSARTQGWYGATVSKSSTGSNQSITVYGRVQPQTAPPAGTYTDTVVVTISY